MPSFQSDAFQSDAFEVGSTSGQAAALIDSPIKQKWGQAMAFINQPFRGFGQAQAKLNGPGTNTGQARCLINMAVNYGHGTAASFPAFGITTTAGNVVVAYAAGRDGNAAQWTPAGSPVFYEVSAWDTDAGQVSPNDPQWLFAARGTTSLTQIDGTFTNLGTSAGAGAIELRNCNFDGIVGGAPTNGYAAFGGSHAVASDTVTPDSNTAGSVICILTIRGDAGGGGIVPSAGWTLVDNIWGFADHPEIRAFIYHYGLSSGSIQFTTSIPNDNRYWATTIGIFPTLSGVTTAGYGQAQCYIKGNAYAQAQTDIKAKQFRSAQAQADIKQTSNGSGQASALILHMSAGQAQALIINTKKPGQAQAKISGQGQGSGQAQVWIKAVAIANGQAQVSITSLTPNGQAQALINQSLHTGQAQARIKAVNRAIGNANTLIKRFIVKWGQAQANIRVYTLGWGQAQATIVRKQLYGQAQCFIIFNEAYGQGQTYIKKLNTLNCGQAQCSITRTEAYGNALAAIKHGDYGQAQALIIVGFNTYGQAQAFILKRKGLGQAQGNIVNQGRAVGQAQAIIQKGAGYGQAQTSIKQKSNNSGQAQAQLGHLYSSQAQAYINSLRYLVKYNNFALPGYAQAESFNSDMSIQRNNLPYLDGSFAEYSGLQNKVITIDMKILSTSLLGAKQELQVAGTILRSAKGFVPLYIQYSNKHYLALTRKIDTGNIARENITHTSYSVEFETKPWLIGETTWTISGTSLIDTGARDYTNGGWTPARIKLSGTDITVSGYNQLGEVTGFISVSGTVTNLVINSESYSATIGGVNKNELMNNLDYAVYVGPGKTYFDINGATSCEISWEDRYYL